MSDEYDYIPLEDRYQPADDWFPALDLPEMQGEVPYAPNPEFSIADPVTLASLDESIGFNVGEHAREWFGVRTAEAGMNLRDNIKDVAPKGLLSTLEDKFSNGSDWIEKHKKTSDIILGMIGGAYAANEKRDAAKALAQSRLDEQNNADRLVQEQNQRYSDSIVNRKRTPPKQQQKLTRIDGTPVFNNGKIA